MTRDHLTAEEIARLDVAGAVHLEWCHDDTGTCYACHCGSRERIELINQILEDHLRDATRSQG